MAVKASYTITLVKVIDGQNAVTIKINAPKGTVIQNGLGSIILEALAYDGSVLITSNAYYQWSELNASGTYTNITGAVSKTYTVTAGKIKNVQTYKCTLSYKNKTYTDSITCIDKTDSIISSTTPPQPAKDMLWLDTSVTPNQLKRYNGTEWIIVSDYDFGVRNLWLNSTFDYGLDSYNIVPSGDAVISLDNDKFNGHNAIILDRNTTGTGRSYAQHKSLPTITSYVAGDEFVLSAWVYIESALNSVRATNVMVRGTAGDAPSINVPSSTPIGKWIKLVSPVFKASSDGTFTSGYILLGDIGKMKISQIMFVKGNKAVDWIAAPEDINNDFNEVETELTESFNSSITQTKDSITQLVESEYTSKNETEELTQQFNTRIEQTSKNVEIQFNTTQELINKLDGKVDTNKQEIQKFIRFIDGQIELGQSNSSFSLTISNNRISFKDSGTEVAYISDSTLYITDAHVTNSLSIGKFAWVPTSSGMGLKYVG